MARAIDGDELELRIASIAKLAKSDAQKALMGRVLYCVEKMPVLATNDHFRDVTNMPTLTPPNEWVSVEDTVPTDDENGLEFFCMTNAMGKCGGVLPLEWEVTTVRGKTVRRWKWFNKISPWRVTHWMKRPAPPAKEE